MKTVKLMIALLLLGAVAVDNAWADHRRHGGHHRHFNRQFSVVIGAPFWDPFYYPRYYPRYYAPLVIERPVPQVYIEQQPSAVPLAADTVNYWYYCSSAKAYYPYVSDCPGGWQKVLPRPPE